jgi:hypothetical protein
MKEGSIEFSTKDEKFTISTHQMFDPDKFVDVVLSMVMRKTQMEAQKEYFNAEIIKNEKAIEDAKKYIENSEKNVEMVSEDIEKARNFLRSVHREDLLIKLDNKAEENRKMLEEQMQKQENQVG